MGVGSLSMMLLFSSCVRDGLEECPPVGGESYLRFVYDYNMAFEDLFHKQVAKMDVFLFDEKGTFIYRMSDECATGKTFPREYVMQIPEEANAATRFVAWPGLHNETRFATSMTPGISTMNDLQVQLKRYNNNLLKEKMRPLWHGTAPRASASLDAEGNLLGNDTTTISLLKNTNTVRIVLQLLDNTPEIDIREFEFTLEAANSAYDCHNNIYAEDRWKFQPYLAYNEDKTCGVVELNTLRLMADRDNRLLVTHTPSKETILDIDLNKYINALKVQDYSGMPLQEYMDREDEYKVIIFLRRGGDAPGKEGWVVAEVRMNPWINRDQDQAGR